jgi:hypothetical protein
VVRGSSVNDWTTSNERSQVAQWYSYVGMVGRLSRGGTDVSGTLPYGVPIRYPAAAVAVVNGESSTLVAVRDRRQR